MSDSDHSDIIAQFTGITQCAPDRAKFFLESAGWNLDVALSGFYEGGGDDDDLIMEDAVGPAAPAASPPAATSPPQPSASVPQPLLTRPAQKSRFATIGSMRADNSDSDDEGDNREAFYAGGSEHGGGQQILGRAKKKDANKFVQDMFEAAKEHGAETVGADSERPRPQGGPGFIGTAYRLGDTEGPSLTVAGAPSSQGPASQVDMLLKLWKNGFSVDDGPLRDYQDPTNQDFLGAIKKGEVPRELVREARGGEVNLNMEDHRTEDYTKPKMASKPFGGEGRRLGSPAGMPSDAGASVAAAAAAPTSAASPAPGGATVNVDTNKPTTSIQIRLADGTRLVQMFNVSHTVADVRQHIISSRPQYDGANFVLMTTFPNKELTDGNQTLQDGQLLNAVMVQRMK